METQRIEPSDDLTRSTGKHLAAIFWGDIDDFVEFPSGMIYTKGDCVDYIKEQGTITFVEFKGSCFGITNNHVIEDRYKTIGQN